MRLIGLTGKARAGKDTVARIIRERLQSALQPVGFVSFAAPIKDGLAAMLGVPRLTFDDPAAKEKPLDWLGVSPRYLMQTLGTEWGRDMVRKEIWLLRAARDIEGYRKFATGAVITDVRFEDEAEWIRKQGGEIWHIRRPAPDNVVRMHASEAGIAVLPGSDSVIHNDRGLEQLADVVRDALGGLYRVPEEAA